MAARVSMLVVLAGQELRPSEAGCSSPKPTESRTDLTCRSTACQAVATRPAFLRSQLGSSVQACGHGEDEMGRCMPGEDCEGSRAQALTAVMALRMGEMG